MHKLKLEFLPICVLLFSFAIFAGEPEAKITRVDGEASILRKGASRTRPVRINMPVSEGDEISSGKESMVELAFRMGEVVRMDENTILKVEKCTNKNVKASTQVGNLWVNMKKLTQRRDFEVATPTAVAAIRGTIYHMSTDQDSTTAVSVYNGKVAVGLSEQLKKQLEQQPPTGEPVEVPGPEEIPGPYEVSLDQWRDIVAGQKISVHKDGKYAQEEFDMEHNSSFIQKCIEYDTHR